MYSLGLTLHVIGTHFAAFVREEAGELVQRLTTLVPPQRMTADELVTRLCQRDDYDDDNDGSSSDDVPACAPAASSSGQPRCTGKRAEKRLKAGTATAADRKAANKSRRERRRKKAAAKPPPAAASR